jgi:H+/Cl- antiporter ClcA
MKSHKFDAISFISGLVVALVGLVFLVPQTPVDLIDAVTSLGAWFWPVLLLAIGLAILVPVFLRQRDEKDESGALVPQTETSDDLP